MVSIEILVAWNVKNYTFTNYHLNELTDISFKWVFANSNVNYELSRTS